MENSKETLTLLGNTILAALKANLIPGVSLLALEIALILLYFKCVPCIPTFVWLAELKSEWGYIYSLLATSFFGGLLPWCIGLATNEVFVFFSI